MKDYTKLLRQLEGWPLSINGPFTEELCTNAATAIRALQEQVRELEAETGKHDAAKYAAQAQVKELLAQRWRESR